ncbi:MAG: YCF48-related protein [Steroidobacteraceae bacterium]
MRQDLFQGPAGPHGWTMAACRLVTALAAAAVIGGCESPLRLEGVKASQAAPVRRSDMFQQAAENGRALVVVGTHGLVLRSTDSGQNWSRQELSGWPSLIDIASCGDGRFAALATESQVFVSTDDGASWKAHPISTEESPQAITCDPGNRLWVVGSFSTIMSSADGGANWEDHSIGEDIILNNIQFIDATHALVFGEFGTNYRSADGGGTWAAGPPLPNEVYPQDVFFSDANEGWVVGLAGEIRHTADGGATWTLESTGTLVPVYSVARQGGQLFAVGGEGTLLRRDGERWIRIEHGEPVRQLLRVLRPLGSDRLLIGGAAGALYVVPNNAAAARAG